MLKSIFVIESMLFGVNFFSGLILTRNIDLDTKATLVSISVLIGSIVAITASHQFEMILMEKEYYNRRTLFLAYILSAISITFFCFYQNFPFYLTIQIGLMSFFSYKNSVLMAKIVKIQSQIEYSLIRLLHIFLVLFINYAAIFLLAEFNLFFLYLCYSLVEIMLYLILKIRLNKVVYEFNNPVTKKIPIKEILSSIFGLNFEVVLLSILSFVLLKDNLALLAVSFSIISPIYVVSNTLIPYILRNSNSVQPNTRKKKWLSLILLIVLMILLFRGFESKLIGYIFGDNYSALTKNSYFLFISGMILQAVRVNDAFLRSKLDFKMSFLSNLIFCIMALFFFSVQPYSSMGFSFIFLSWSITCGLIAFVVRITRRNFLI